MDDARQFVRYQSVGQCKSRLYDELTDSLTERNGEEICRRNAPVEAGVGGGVTDGVRSVHIGITSRILPLHRVDHMSVHKQSCEPGQI